MKRFNEFINESTKTSQMLVAKLCKALDKKDADEAAKLIHAGADVNYVDEEGWTALLYAIAGASMKYDNILKKLILAGADVNHQTYHGMNALIIAMNYSNIKAIEILIKAGTDLTIKDKEGEVFVDKIKYNYAVITKWLKSEEAQRMILSRAPSLISAFSRNNIPIHPNITLEYPHLISGVDLNLL